MMMALVCIIFSVLFSSVFIGQTLSADCGTKTEGYGTSTFSETPSNEAVKTILTSEDGYYSFDCCGVIKKWSFVVKTAATVKFQVWRFSTTYTVVGENTFTVPSGAENEIIEFEVPESERITVKQNDVFGWQGDYIAYSDGSGHYPKGFRIRNQVFNVGDTFNFQGIGNKINNRAYAITATTTNSASPYFYNLPQTIHVYDHIAIGTSVFAVSAKDDDSDYDGISLTLSTPSSYFTLSTAELQTSASISSLTGTTQSLSVKVEDSCGKSTTSTLTIIVRNQNTGTRYSGYAPIRLQNKKYAS